MRTCRWPVAVAAVLGVLVGVIEAVTRILPLILDGGGASAAVVGSGPGPARYVLSTVGPLLVGYWCGREADVAAGYGRISLAVGVAGGVGAFVGAYLVGFRTTGSPFGYYLPDVGRMALVLVVEFAIAGLAGAAVGQFRSE